MNRRPPTSTLFPNTTLFRSKHVVYVWIDALSNYITALGYPDHPADFNRYWPADVHLVGKEITRFHTIIWPAMLMALDIPLPRQVYGHGWLLFKDGKMSKSKGNVIDPVVLCDKYSVDAIRYFLLREVPFGSDGIFSNEALINRINSDLANDLGNLVSRTVAMIDKYFPDGLPVERIAEPLDADLQAECTALPGRVTTALDKLQFSQALTEIWKVVGRSNKYIDDTAPWILARTPSQAPRLAAVLFNLAESIRIVSILLQPFMPSTPAKIQSMLGLDDPQLCSWHAAETFGLYPVSKGVRKGEPIFPRIDIAKEIAELDAMLATQQAEVAAAQPIADATATVEKESEPEGVSLIEFSDFLKVSLRVGTVVSCEKVKGSDKLLCSQIDMGGEIRQIVSGIAQSYQPDDMPGRQVIVVTNLQPRKIRGVESNGMLLCATTSDGYRLLSVEQPVPPGSEVG